MFVTNNLYCNHPQNTTTTSSVDIALDTLNSNNHSNQSSLGQLVVNLSDYTLTHHEEVILAKGMKFCPTPGEPNFGELREDLNKFYMKIRCKLFFDNMAEEDKYLASSRPSQDPNGPFCDTQFKEPSKWKPPPVTSLEVFSRQNEIGLLQNKVPPSKFDNLTRDEKKTLKSLSLNKAIVIKNADKGGAVVVLNTTDYIKEGLRQLSDPYFYTDTPTDLTHTNTEYINAYINANIDYALPHLWA